MKLQFTKMHGLGNDFVVFDGIHQTVTLSPRHIRTIADRHFGVGCDQVLVVETPSTPAADFRYRIFNADGREVEQCGNGARCFARFVHDQGLTRNKLIRVETAAGLIQLLLEVDGQVTVNMGKPRFKPADIPFMADTQTTFYPITVAGEKLEISVVSMGNPHAVLVVGDVTSVPVGRLGPLIEHHELFPRRTNVGFMEVVQPNRIRLRVFERGVGETLACGTGACAAVVVGRVRNLLAESVWVDLPGGTLGVRWEGDDEAVTLTGPAIKVFEGWIEI
jgi:diaminopimelate epimerase